MVSHTRKSIAAATVLLAACALPAATAYQYTVGVGKDQSTGQPGLGFDPSRTTIADVNTANTVVFTFLEGVLAVFTFLEGIHRVVQTDGSLNGPCSASGGFDTGVQTVAAGSNGPNFTFDVDNNTATYYFADIGASDAYSPCYLGAVFCVNTDETSSTTSCHAVQAAAITMGKQLGVTTTQALSTSTSTTASSTSSGASSSSSSSSAASTTSSSSSSAATSSASRTSATGSNAQAAASSGGGSSGAGSLSVTANGGLVSAIGIVGAAMAALFVAAV